MADLVLGPLVSMVNEKVSSYVLDKYRVMEGMEEQRRILERKLPAILDIIHDAEEKGAFRPGVRAWLKDMKTVAYEASDVFDEFNYEALRREAEKKGHNSKLSMDAVRLFPSRNPIVFRYRMGKKLRRIVQTIEVLVTEMNTFGFTHMQQAPPSKQWRKTGSIMDDSDENIVSRSRGEEKKKFMKILLDEAENMDLTILPIVGMGGLGKTTFVQLIYNDPAIEKYFELRMWYCVSDGFDTAKIASNKSHEETSICGKRYLIVLDDVWNQNLDNWGTLKTCLKQGGKGSVVLATTRDEEVAQIMVMGVANKPYHIEKLSDEYLKEIVQSKAFSLQKPNSDNLDGIVDKIVGRCAGSPLAAKAIGSMLSTKTSMEEWNNILAKSNICNERSGILPILKLSFDDLPAHMKQCFAFCAIFPKDYEIDVELLIQLWIAHDFIPVQEDDHAETTGEEIFKVLTWRSFFQEVKQTSSGYKQRLHFRNKTICKIHDLMHDIALSVMAKECATIVDKKSMKKLLPNPTRHLFLSSYDETLLDDIWKKQSPTLRTLFSTAHAFFPHIPKYTSLRVLHLARWKQHGVRVRHLQHLRYLNLSGNHMLKKLPEDISILYNLQTLDLSYCEELCQLPKDMKYMASLRHLYTSGCKSLTYMPPGLGQITCLQTLTYFVVGSATSGCSAIGEIKKLNLGGELELSGLENADEVDAKAASFKNKEKLTHLSLEWNSVGQEEPVQDCHEKVLHALEPHGGLQMLRIVKYKGSNLPSWISYLSNLTELHLLGCILCKEFPQLCQLKVLGTLYLKKLEKWRSLCSDTTSTPYPKLKELHLYDLESLERWVAEGKGELTFPELENLDIYNCPKLASLPEAPKLKNMQLDEGKVLLSLEIIKSRHMSSLSSLQLSTHDAEATSRIDQNHESSLSELTQATPRIDDDHRSTLSHLVLYGCHFLFSSSASQLAFGAWKWFGQLDYLAICNCDVLMYWPEEVFRNLISLTHLSIHSCNKLIGPTHMKDGEPAQKTDQVLPRLNTIYISSCESLAELIYLPLSLRTIYIENCPLLEDILGKEEHLETCTPLEHCRNVPSVSMLEKSRSPTNRHPCLEELLVTNCGNLVTIPNLPPSLKCLSICFCVALCSLSGSLDALERLEIAYCDKLETLPNLPPSLKYLDINFCGALCSVSGHVDALEELKIYCCKKLKSLDDVRGLSSLQHLYLASCECLASLPGCPASYSALRRIEITYCPAIDMEQLYKCQKQRLDSLEYKNISHAHSSDPDQGPKLREPKSWQYAIPWCRRWAIQRHRI